MIKVPENYRVLAKKDQVLGTEANSGNNGFFIIPHPKIYGYEFRVKASDGMGWEHVSITLGAKHRKVERCPTWQEMCYIKETFWDEFDTVLQYHPPKSDHISMHDYCLHLWRPTNIDVPVPNSLLVGIEFDKIAEKTSPIAIGYTEEIYNFIESTMPMVIGADGQRYYDVAGSWQKIIRK